jgi:hypothetical protein
MSTDGGGWTLVLNNSTFATCPSPSWSQAVNEVTYTGNINGGLRTGFDYFFGVKYWNMLGSQMRLDMGNSPTDLSHRAYYDFYLDDTLYYALRMSNERVTIQKTGTASSGMYTGHNNQPLSTGDADHDSSSGSCSANSYSSTPWWYTNCWSGSFWGGASSGTYTNNPYWTGSSSEYFPYGSIWIRDSAVGNSSYVLSKGNAYSLRVYGSQVSAVIGNQTVNTSFSTPYVHLVMTYKNSGSNNFNLYVNGQLKAQATASISIPVNNTSLLLGSGFRGSIDEVVLYSSVLTANEVQQRYNLVSGGLVGKWKFDKGMGTLAEDSSGYGHHGTLTNGPLWADSPLNEEFGTWEEPGNALSFDGVNDYVEGGDSNLLDMGTNSHSVEAWIYLNGMNSYAPVIAKRSGGTVDFNYHISDSANDRRMASYNGTNSVGGNTPLELNRWNYVVWVYQAGKVYFYLNGKADGVASQVSGAANSANLFIGTDNGSTKFYLSGLVDEVALYNRALDPWEIARKYEKYSWNLIGRWSFDETSGTTVTDSSHLKNDGTLFEATRPASTLGPAQQGAPTGNMLLFDGNNDYVDLTTPQTLALAKGSYTLTLWFKIASQSHSSALFSFGKASASQETDCFVHYPSGNIGCNRINNGKDLSFTDNSANYVDGKWHYLVVTYDMYEKRHSLYVDGNLKQNRTNTAFQEYTIDQVWLGMMHYDGSPLYGLNGNLDNVEFYDRDFVKDQVPYKMESIRRSGYPTAQIGLPVNDASFNLNTAITVSSSPSTDLYGTNPGIVGYFWDLDNGTPIAKLGSSVTVSYNTPGDKKIKLWVIDQDGNPSLSRLGFGFVNIHITSNTFLFQRLDNLQKKRATTGN